MNTNSDHRPCSGDIHDDPLCGCYTGHRHTCGPGHCRACAPTPERTRRLLGRKRPLQPHGDRPFRFYSTPDGQWHAWQDRRRPGGTWWWGVNGPGIDPGTRVTNITEAQNLVAQAIEERRALYESEAYDDNPAEATKLWDDGYRPRPASQLAPEMIVAFRETDPFTGGPVGKVRFARVHHVALTDDCEVHAEHTHGTTTEDDGAEVWAK